MMCLLFITAAAVVVPVILSGQNLFSA